MKASSRQAAPRKKLLSLTPATTSTTKWIMVTAPSTPDTLGRILDSVLTPEAQSRIVKLDGPLDPP